jgi:hypothetical protein
MLTNQVGISDGADAWGSVRSVVLDFEASEGKLVARKMVATGAIAKEPGSL